jgi:hypothetical protein
MSHQRRRPRLDDGISNTPLRTLRNRAMAEEGQMALHYSAPGRRNSGHRGPRPKDQGEVSPTRSCVPSRLRPNGPRRMMRQAGCFGHAKSQVRVISEDRPRHRARSEHEGTGPRATRRRCWPQLRLLAGGRSDSSRGETLEASVNLLRRLLVTALFPMGAGVGLLGPSRFRLRMVKLMHRLNGAEHRAAATD